VKVVPSSRARIAFIVNASPIRAQE